jgi:hypothetical protein
VVAALVVIAAAVGISAARAATAPETIVSDYVINYDKASFWFRSDVADATFECSLDDAAFTTCVSPQSYAGLPVGGHTFQVRAVDAAGTADPTPANLSWTASAPPPPPEPAPANDNFFGAQSISGASGSVDGSNVGATQQWDEPYNPVGGGHSVWFVWTAPYNGSITFSAAATAFAPTVAVYLGDSTDRVVLLASGVGSATFKATQGSSYRVAVDGSAGGTGAFTLSWAYEPTGAPANDYFGDAQSLEGQSGSVNGSNVAATVEFGEPDHSGTSTSNDGGHSVWYRWTAPADGTAIFTTEGSAFDTVMRAYSGSSVDALFGQGAYLPDVNPWTTWSRVLLNVRAGDVYSIAIDGANGATGDFMLGWRMTTTSSDTQLPTVQMWSPEPSATVSGTITFKSDAFDDTAIDRVEYEIGPNGSGDSYLVGTAYEWPYAVDLDTKVLPDGLYSVNGASYGFSITIQNAAPPTLTVPKNMVVEATSARGAVAKFSASATDSAGYTVPVTCKPSSGTVFALGTAKVTCSATSSGLSTTKSFTITVVDTTPPALSVSDVVADAVSPDGAPVAYTATAVDRVSGAITPACSPASGSTFAIGDTKVTCTASDTRGNTADARFTVHVKGAAEQTAELRAVVASLALADPLRTKLDEQLADVQTHIADGPLTGACGGLADFTARVRKEVGRGLTSEQADRLAADATRIRSVLAC